MTLPVHRWFRFPAGFSADWARKVISEFKPTLHGAVVLDPFAGVGTTVLAGEEAGVASCGLEAQPFIARIAQTKLLWHTDANGFMAFVSSVAKTAGARNGLAPVSSYPRLIPKCYPEDVLRVLHNLRVALAEVADGQPVADLTWLALCAILRHSSPVGTAPWQYVLPNKSKAKATPPHQAFSQQVETMAWDMHYRQRQGIEPLGRILHSDARTCDGVDDDSIGLVVTSPPYPNNYDYADATRLEMSFFGEVAGWGDLQKKARSGLIRSCSQHVSIENTDLYAVLSSLSDTPIIADLEEVCRKLSIERLNHGGKKDYHLMVAAYFADMHMVWKALRRVCKNGATACFVIGDSAPYGVYVPVDRWLGALALHAGFKSYRFEKLRDRNVKWLNRKHRVPLQEGRLWVDG
ncbi:MAG: DNA modification methylase [Chloroflexota bacterium]|nr:DNA modification methylase [Chloroflexota bacterium]